VVTDGPTRPSQQDRSAPRSSTRRRRTVIALLASLGVVLLALTAALVYGYQTVTDIADNFEKVPDAFPDEASRPTVDPGESIAVDGRTPLTVLLLGSDGLTTSQSQRGQRSDATMVVRISAERDRVDVVSIPRDTWVPIPGRGEAKINAAYSFGGFPLAVSTVEDLLGVRIDHVASIDMGGLIDMTDALGGIDVKLDEGFTSSSGTYTFTEGVNHLNGKEALALARERKQLAEGDLSRVENQQLVLQALLVEALSRDTLTDPRSAVDFASTTAGYTRVDDGVTADFIRDLAWQMRGFDMSELHFHTMGLAGFGRSADGQSILVTDPAATERLAAALRTDTMETYVE